MNLLDFDDCILCSILLKCFDVKCISTVCRRFYMAIRHAEKQLSQKYTVYDNANCFDEMIRNELDICKFYNEKDAYMKCESQIKNYIATELIIAIDSQDITRIKYMVAEYFPKEYVNDEDKYESLHIFPRRLKLCINYQLTNILCLTNNDANEHNFYSSITSTNNISILNFLLTKYQHFNTFEIALWIYEKNNDTLFDFILDKCFNSAKLLNNFDERYCNYDSRNKYNKCRSLLMDKLKYYKCYQNYVRHMMDSHFEVHKNSMTIDEIFNIMIDPICMPIFDSFGFVYARPSSISYD